MNINAEICSKLFDEPRNKTQFFEVVQIRSSTIISPNFLYDIGTSEES